MRKTLAAALAALTFGTAAAVAAAPSQAEARGYRSHYYRHDRSDAGVAVAAGVVGLALGAALASNGGRYGSGYYEPYPSGYGGYYGRPYYGRPYYGRHGYSTCETERWGYDPYTGERVLVRSRYRC